MSLIDDAVNEGLRKKNNNEMICYTCKGIIGIANNLETLKGEYFCLNCANNINLLKQEIERYRVSDKEQEKTIDKMVEWIVDDKEYESIETCEFSTIRRMDCKQRFKNAKDLNLCKECITKYFEGVE